MQVKKDFTSCVHLQNVDGHRYLMIDLDDPDIQVNGMSVEIPETTLPPTSEEAMLEQLGTDFVSLESTDSAADEPDERVIFSIACTTKSNNQAVGMEIMKGE